MQGPGDPAEKGSCLVALVPGAAPASWPPQLDAELIPTLQSTVEFGLNSPVATLIGPHGALKCSQHWWEATWPGLLQEQALGHRGCSGQLRLPSAPFN